MTSQITKEIVIIVAEVLKKNKEEVDPSFSFEKLGADSLDMFEMILKWEDSFSVEISDDEFDNLKSIPDVVTLIEKKLHKKEP